MRIEVIGAATLYLGDCRDVLPWGELPADALIVTDPPYNVGYHYDAYNDNLSDDDYWALLETFNGRSAVFIHYMEALFRLSYVRGEFPEKVAAWVYNANTPKQFRGIAWFGATPNFSLDGQDYKNPNDKRVQALIERGMSAKLYDWWHVEQVKNVSEEKTPHPCQIPLLVKRRIINITPSSTIVDPFTGSGTTAVAAVQAGRAFIGSELDPTYFDIACRRIEQAQRQADMFIKAST